MKLKIVPSRSAVFNLLGIVALSAAFAGKVKYNIANQPDTLKFY